MKSFYQRENNFLSACKAVRLYKSAREAGIHASWLDRSNCALAARRHCMWNCNMKAFTKVLPRLARWNRCNPEKLCTASAASGIGCVFPRPAACCHSQNLVSIILDSTAAISPEQVFKTSPVTAALTELHRTLLFQQNHLCFSRKHDSLRAQALPPAGRHHLPVCQLRVRQLHGRRQPRRCCCRSCSQAC